MPKNEINQPSKVVIKSDPLIRMITHVLRFGHEAVEEAVEVMGVCIGNLDENQKIVNVFNIIPIQHGIQVSTGFTKEDIELFTKLDQDYQEKDMKIVGWYISRPGWGLDFTEITIHNHQFFQTDKNPLGFIIIFDHTLMGKEKDFGFKIYSLKDYHNSNEYHEVPYEIEIPATLNFFKWVQKFMEDSQRLSPILIKELKEQGIRELQDIPLSEEDLIEKSVTDYSIQIEQVFSGFRDGISKLNETINGTYKTQLNPWIGDLTQGTLKGIEHISNSLSHLKNTVSDGLRDLQQFFNNTYIEISGLFKKNTGEYINKRVEGQKELKNEISNLLEKSIEDSKIKIEEKVKNNVAPLEEKIKTLLETLDTSSKSNSKMSELTIDLNTHISNAKKDLKNLTNNISENIENVIIPFKTQINDKFEELELELKPIKESYSEIKILCEKLQKTITEFRNLA